MRVWLAGLILALTSSCGLFLDERWEGRAEDCSNGVADFDVLLLLDAPTAPAPTGYVGYAGTNARDTWTIAPIEDAMSSPGGLTFTAQIDLGGETMDVEVELTAEPDGTYTGEWKHEVRETVRCDVELERQ